MEVKKMPEEIDYESFKPRSSDDFVSMTAGEPIKLKLQTVKQTTREVPDTNQPADEQGNHPMKTIPCIEYSVVAENDIEVNKLWKVSSKRLVFAMKKINDKIIAGNPVEITITQYGSGFNTYYKFAEFVKGSAQAIISTKAEEKK